MKWLNQLWTSLLGGNDTPVIEDDEAWKIYIRDKGLCPDCETGYLKPGPRGGMSQNYECMGCGSRFNIAKAPGFFWVERLPNREPERMRN